MNNIKSLDIKGFKKFEYFHVDFNEHMNVIVGENESGKSTILDAIKTVLNQQYRNADKAVLQDLFNVKQVKEFEANPSVKTLPSIIIEVELELDPKAKNVESFYGEAHGKQKSRDEKYGVRFECKYDEELGSGMEESINEGKIPYEYYNLKWTTFAKNAYQIIRRPIKLITIDTTSGAANYSFNYYNRSLFVSKCDEHSRAKAKNDFRTKLIDAFKEADLPALGDNRKFGVDTKKVVLETILSVYENDIALENRGSGMESLIKTEIALEKANGLDVILMEEPENHLSFTTLRKMLKQISDKQKYSQIIVVTHSSMIASRLNINNILWITEGKVKSLVDVDKEVADFFTKADNNALLQLLLSEKVFLVEGATEFLLLPYLYKQVTGHTIEENGISIISCNGISYKKYLKIAEETQKKIAVITDNDGNQDKINLAKELNENNTLQHVFMDESVENWTWEICIYNCNEEILPSVLKLKSSAKYLYHQHDYGNVLGKMLNNKVDTAYEMINSGKVFGIPQYIEEAITWLKK